MEKFLLLSSFWIKKEKALLVLICLALISVTLQNSSRKHWQKSHIQSPENLQDANSTRPNVYIKKTHLILNIPFFQNWRKEFEARLSPYDKLGLVRGFFLGSDENIPGAVQKTFKDAGLYHLLSASGFNCFVVALFLGSAAQLIFYFLMGFFPAPLALEIKKWLFPTAQLLGAWLFWLWSNQSPPITRAAILISLKQVLELLKIRTSFLRVLFIQYLFSLIFFPKLWSSASFQLSFGCLFGILVFQKLFRNSLFWNYIAVNCGACLGALPTTWIFFQEINFNSVLTNWFAIPVVSFLIMPLSLIEMFLLPLPGLSLVCNVLSPLNAFIANILYKCLEIYCAFMPSLRYTN